jgi:sterol desaturase/sphingolipid hydroxylase (fatty acid hydroxylase superfamily)
VQRNSETGLRLRVPADSSPWEPIPAPRVVFPNKEATMLSTVLVVILILLLIGALPRWQYSSGWGYYPSGGIGLIVLILIILLLMGRI